MSAYACIFVMGVVVGMLLDLLLDFLIQQCRAKHQESKGL